MFIHQGVVIIYLGMLDLYEYWPIIFGASDDKLGGGLEARLLECDGHVPHQFGGNGLPIDTTQYSFK